MARKRNYLLGHGEKLAQNEVVKLGFGEGRDPYSLSESKAYIAPLARIAAKSMDALPTAACPHDEAVAMVTLHPKFLSKSQYPTAFLDATGLRSVGSKAVTVTPRKSHLGRKPQPSASAVLFVAGPRARFRELAGSIPSWTPSTPGASDLIKVEELHAPSVKERIKPIHSKAKTQLFEVILHAGEDRRRHYILDAFRDYLNTIQIAVDLDARLDADELSFVPVRTSQDRLEDVASFSFLRAVREMSRLRELWPSNGKGAPNGKVFSYSAPTGDALDPTIRVAVFDGGQPDIKSMRPWVRRLDAAGVTSAVNEYLNHGCAVTSALLFGSIEDGKAPERPYARVDHYRVLDTNTELEPQASLYPVLKRIAAVLEREPYDFVNFSIGPSIPIDDDDIHPWTAKLDPLLANGRTLATGAVGNSGEADASMQLNRIQPPSDCVNMLSVGASDGAHASWARASYSCVGHGRCPGVMKPDGVVHGGTPKSPFWVVDAENPTKLLPVTGTSFASPSVLRTAIGVRAHLGPVMGSMALKALMIHHCHQNGHHPSEVGWGQFCSDVEQLITCADDAATIVYQGELDPKKFLRAQIPIPAKVMNGFVTITATICIATETDPQHPLTYTRSGLQIFFRKDRLRVKTGKTNPASSGFFKTGLGMPERLIRSDAHQWETVRHATKRMRAAELKNPCFDIHYNPRDEGHDTAGKKIPYGMIITISAPKVHDLFDQIHNRYRFQLAELRPKLDLPIRLT